MSFIRNTLLVTGLGLFGGLVLALSAPPVPIQAADAVNIQDCNEAKNSKDCKRDFKQCGNGRDDKTKKCQRRIVNKYTGKGVKEGRFSTGAGQHKTIRDVCGGDVNGSDNSVGIAINIGCDGKGNPIADMAFAVIRILTTLVGFVIIGSIVYGGIQYAGSRGDPQSTAMAVNRIRSSIFALLLFIFGFAILNYLIPAGFLR